MVLNPVEAQLVAEPSDGPWSGHRATVSGHAPPWVAAERLIDFFGAWGGDGLERYAEFVDSGSRAGGAGVP